MLRKAFQDAVVVDQLLPSNPVERAKRPCVMKEHRARQAEERLTAGPEWVSGDEYVFTTGWGGPVYPDTVSSLIGDLIRAHNVTVGESSVGEPLPHARLHDLRHVHATTSCDAKIDWKALSKRIGHADVAFTMNQYVQTDLEADRRVATTLAELIIGGSLASTEVGDLAR